MKRVGVGILLLAVLIGGGLYVWFAGDDTVRPLSQRSYTIGAVPELNRVEIDRPIPRTEEGRQTLVLVKRGESWFFEEPIEAEVAPFVAKKLNTLFDDPIPADDLPFGKDDLQQYGLDAANRSEVTLRGSEAERTITMGLGIRVAETDARRTFVLDDRGDVHRMRSDFGIVFAQPITTMRNKGVFAISPNRLNAITIEHTDGETYRFWRDEGSGWEVSSEPRFELEQSLMRSMQQGFTNFRVRGFISGSAEDAGLGEPDTIVTFGTLDGDRVLRVVEKTDERFGADRYFATFEDTNEVFELVRGFGSLLVADRHTLRKRLTREIGRGALTRVELAGDAGVVIEREGDAWMQRLPLPGEASPKELSKFLGNLEMLTVIRYGDIDRSAAGLDMASRPSRVVAHTNTGEKHVLLLGRPTEERDGYWAAWEDGEDVFVLPPYLYDRLHPGPTEILRWSTMKIAFVMDPIESVGIDADTTFAFMLAAQERGHDVYYLGMDELSARGREAWATARPVEVRRVEGDHFTLGDDMTGPLHDFDAVFMRKDPPFDVPYLHAAHLLELAEELGTLVVNKPSGLRAANEKLYALHFHEVMPRTRITRLKSEVKAFLNEVGGSCILKPVDGHGGDGVLLLRGDDKNLNALIELTTENGRELAVCQEYLPEAREGDKRIIMLDGEPLGGILRVPPSGENRGNIHVGGTVERAELTKADLEICSLVGPRLSSDGLWFVGLDVIGGKLTEVNVTSPTGIQEMSRLNGVDGSGRVIEWIEDRI